MTLYRSRHPRAATNGESFGHRGRGYGATGVVPRMRRHQGLLQSVPWRSGGGDRGLWLHELVEELIEEISHQLLVGDAAEIRRLADGRRTFAGMRTCCGTD
jgi:hypothetical protein